MPRSSHSQVRLGRRYALCVGIRTYTNLRNRSIRYAGDDARAIAQRLEGSLPDSFEVTLLTEPAQTSKAALNEAVEHLLSAPDRQAEDLAVLYFSCHGDLSAPEETFCLLSSDAAAHPDGGFEPATFIGISDLARWFSQARMRNIVLLLDVCHSGGAGVALRHFTLNLSAGPNYFIIGGARLDQKARQSSQLRQGMFTHCLLRAFEQPPVKEGWLTISQVHTFVSEEIGWFAQEHPIQIQGVSISVNPNLPLLRNPCYPELCPVPPIWTIPQPRNPFFTGQEGLLARLTTTLQQEQKTVLSHPQAIAGLGGIGKTQLALEYAYRHRQDYHAILWSLADTREALISTFMSIAVLLDLPEKEERDQLVIVEAVKRWFAGRSKWLLILDNADELSIVEEFIPPAFQGHLLITTRAQVTGALAGKIEVEVMSPEAGALLLLRRAGLIASRASLDRASPDESALAQELAQELGGLPLALDQAGAYVEEMQCSLSEYLQLYRTHRAALLGKRGERSPAYPESVATTWSLSFQKVEQRNPAATELLRLFAFLAPDAIPEEIVLQGAPRLGASLQSLLQDGLAFNEAIGALRAFSLVYRDRERRTFSVHRLVQEVLKGTMDEAMQKQWAERVIKMLSAAFSFEHINEVGNWPYCERVLPHALVGTFLSQQYDFIFPEVPRLLLDVAIYLYDRGRYTESEPLVQHALSAYQRVRGHEHINVADSLNVLANLYLAQAKYEQIESLYQLVLSIFEQEFGPDSHEVAGTLSNLANLYFEQAKYKQAKVLYQQALSIYERNFGPEHIDVAASINALARLYNRQGDHKRAEPLYQQALTIYERQLGSKHPSVTGILNNLGTVSLSEGKYEQAEMFLQRSLGIREEILGPEHPEVAETLLNLAELQRKRGTGFDNIVKLYKAANFGDLTESHRREEEREQAESHLQRALSIFEQALGSGHPKVADCLNTLALLYGEQAILYGQEEKYKQAESLFYRALTIYEQALGPEHSDVGLTLKNLASLYMMRGEEYEQAEALYRRALAIYQQAFGRSHSQIRVMKRNIALLATMRKARSVSHFLKRIFRVY